MTAKYVMRYLPEHDITFIHNPKTAGTSISAWLDSNFKTVSGRKHGHCIEVEEFFPKTRLTFGVVRNPWARMVSWYKFANHGNETFENWMLARFHIHQTGLTFHPQVSWALPWYTLGTPQADWFDDNTLILKYENLHNDFKRIKKILRCEQELCILNKNETYDYKDYYNDDLIELVHHVFIKDIIRYNYTYEI